jgi:hypothetical protein
VAGRPAAGGGRWVDVDAERLAGWLRRFVERHPGGAVEVAAGRVTVTGADGALAEVEVPYGPLVRDDGDRYGGLVAHVTRPRRLGLLLVRLGGHAVGVAAAGAVVAGKTGSRPVHGRSAAGGWSQQRFARRREGQAKVALQAAADAAAQVLVPEVASLDALVTGGDRAAVADVLADPRLASLRALPVGGHLDVPDPRRRVLEQAARDATAVRIRVLDPSADG